MADINVERKSPSIWPWIIGLLVLALLIWAVAEMVDTGEEPEVAMDTEFAEEVQPLPEPTPAPVAGLAVTDIIDSPDTWTGQTVNGEVNVVEVPTDRGFWIEQEGERLFVLLEDQPAEQPADIQAGQTLNITEATVRDATFLENLQNLDEDTRNILEGEEVFLVVNEENLEMAGQDGMMMEGQEETTTGAASEQY